MLTAQRLQGDGGLETLRWLARHQGYRAALDHALTTAQTPGSRLHTDAWQWVIGPDAGLFRACREAVALGREALFTEWASALDALIPDRRESHRFFRARLHAVLACARAVCCLRQDVEPGGALMALGDALSAWAGTTLRHPVVDTHHTDNALASPILRCLFRLRIAIP
jgi:hypothetical protein